MLNVPERPPSSIKPAETRLSLVQWLEQVIDSPQVRVQVRSRGNNLYILCEGQTCPPRSPLLLRVVQALAKTNLERFIADDQPQVYQVLLYGRVLGQPHPDWAEVIYLNQIDRYLEKLQKVPARSVSLTDDTPSSSLAIANIRLAKQGRPDAIARYLSESLNSLGVAVRASVKTIPSKDGELDHSRLWVMCESAYSPDASLMAESIAQKLRDLELTGFESAIVFSQVHGELQPDWTLRVDLTPPDEMLKAWARWGDPAAISRLLDRTFDQQIHASATLKDTTLHISCVGENAPDQRRVIAAIKLLLETIAPQGIQSAAVYGVEAPTDSSKLQPSEPDSPAWVEWLNLPASIHPALSDSTHWLAEKGDIPAIAFLLSRLLNPDLDRQLATGGIRIQVRQKEDLLHIMADAPLCPPQNRVGTAIARFLKPLDIPGVAGVRIYGRRAGQARPAWSYGADFGFRDRIVPAATPEFAASDEYVGDLLTESGELTRRPDLTADDLRVALNRLLESMQGILTRSQLFVVETPSHRSLDAKPRMAQNTKLALVWGTLGLLLTVQSDWILGQLLKPKTEPKPTAIATVSPAPVISDEITLPQISLQKPGIGRGDAFNGSGFTQSGQTVLSTDDPSPTPAITGAPTAKALAAAQLQQKAVVDATRSPYPTFNARQLDEKLVLYRQYIEKSGAPDVLVVGSSRAMRGIDPAALQQALAAQGYPGLKIFNFGVNGATAQVVDLIVRRLLPAEKMPKLIIWADGSRAINSGRVDVTYNAIAVSQGFKKIPIDSSSAIASAPTPPEPESSVTTSLGTISSTNSVVADSYQTVNTWLNQSLANLSSTYDQRESLKTLFQRGVASGFKSHPNSEQDTDLTISQDGQGLIDVNGFLPISNRFNPATYYQKYSRVAGNSDSDYADFRLEGRQSAAIASLAAFTQSQKIPLVFINLPLSGEYLDSVRRNHEQAFQQYMLRTSAELGFTYRNLAEEWKTEHDFFSDPSHLNRYGAFAVANHIAKDPLIPWAKR
ncbi:DUF1574 domain-containing protein [Phormidesmis priestleyi ULC007]|uniref:DUF1574 domain-containing protein n=1 Tax=Phormidesmis priestleyi ULC007 TaxID=1920490 RepID=A0A2T1DLC5_9CYAN|nr:hypothetical protein [Phormidesmis priestleyi]PSB21214.1 DUF1574 domain-containing protein [Phormidesmis priestleyi ULC007]PZO51258.1 MAG: DUF1574 domain-containing protein [Phormidesmis priestleyi]